MQKSSQSPNSNINYLANNKSNFWLSVISLKIGTVTLRYRNIGLRKTYGKLELSGSDVSRWAWDRRHDGEQHLCFLLGCIPSIGSDGQLRTSLYDKRDDFNFHITDVPFLSRNIPSSPVYWVFISQLVRYTRACSFYECFILRAVRDFHLSFEDRDMSGNVWNCPSGSFMVDMGISLNIWSLPLPNVTWYSWTWPYTVTPSIDQTLHQFANLLPTWTVLPILTLLTSFGGFHGTLQQVRLTKRGRLLLRTPCPVPFRTCICSNVETIFTLACHVYRTLNFEHPSVLLFCLFIRLQVILWPFI